MTFALLLCLSALPVLVGRLLVPGHGLSPAGTYEALAHIWVGVMLALAVERRRTRAGRVALGLLVALTAFETGMFLAGRPHPPCRCEACCHHRCSPAAAAAPAADPPAPGVWQLPENPESYEARWRRIAPEIYEDPPCAGGSTSTSGRR